MANWTTLTIDELKAAEHGAIIDAAQLTATGAAPDPVSRIITDVTAKIRAVISPGNVLDVDPTKIPRSLIALAARMCVRSLKQRIQMDLTVDERDQRREDNEYLQLLVKENTAFESADTPSGTAEMQQTGDRIEQVTGTTIDSGGGPATPFGRQATDGLM
jgi:hypothetical protein